MARYLSISPVQEPFDPGAAPKGRVELLFNVSCWKVPSGTLIEELLKRLEAQGVGTRGSNMFGSSAAQLPDGDGPYLSVIATGGAAPDYIQNLASPAYQHASAQIAVRGAKWTEVEAMAYAAYNALSSVRNTTLST